MMTSSANAPNAQDAVQEIQTPRAVASPQVTRTFIILAGRLSSFLFALEGLNRRAKRLGVPALTCVSGKAYFDGEVASYNFAVPSPLLRIS